MKLNLICRYAWLQKLLLIVFFISFVVKANAQTELLNDSLSTDSLSKVKPRRKKINQDQPEIRVSDTVRGTFGEEKVLNPPTRAALFAAAVPGLGQVYNKKYWKVPLVFGGFVVFASLIDFNNERYILYRDALALKVDDDDSTNPTDIRVVNGSVDQIRRGRDSFRRDRDFNIILTFAWYGLTVADAVVDAHLGRFNINEDLSAKIRPGVIDTGFNQPAAGIKFIVYLGDAEKKDTKKFLYSSR
jgi:hypothetical protein